MDKIPQFADIQKRFTGKSAEWKDGFTTAKRLGFSEAARNVPFSPMDGELHAFVEFKRGARSAGKAGGDNE